MRLSISRRPAIAGLLGLTLSVSVLLAGCNAASSTPSSDPSGSPAASSQAPSASPSALPEDGGTAFQAGTWLSDQGQYYFFDADGASGRTASLADGTGVAFSYTVDGDKAAFSMGGADNSSACTVSRDGDTITMAWEDGTTEQLTYVSDQGSDTFQFYSNQELEDLALTYYQENNGAQDNQNLASAAQTTEDGSVSIQVYENLGDHNSTAAWYTVDRVTAAGTDGSGNEVDLAD